MKKILIAIPIVNEEKNIGSLVEKIKTINGNFHILFIDDDSDDNSEILISNLSKKYQIFYIKRNEKLGIGSAHKKAITWAIEKNYDILITMDGDGTHDPSYIPVILENLGKFKIVNTTRFSKKNMLIGWSSLRIAITRLRFFLVRILLNTNLDSSSGFRAYDLKYVKKTDLLLSENNSYFFLVESLFYLEKQGYDITEIPAVLNARGAGVSKMNLKHFSNAIFNLIRLTIKYNFDKKKK
jgi:dolichol-phosphate mannosyltransferase